MYILGIDTSCDDTSISVIKLALPGAFGSERSLKLEILSNIISSQVKLHAKYGGVWPFIAKREHQKKLPIVFKKATQGIDISNIDLIGVTIGPGLEPCLWQGINFAKHLAEKLKKPLIPVNHLEAHILINLSWQNSEENLFPAICLVVSGGHTILFLMKEIGKYKILGETRDDAAGECFDKVARILGLGYPGGPAIARLGKVKIRNGKGKIKLPRPMLWQKNYDFSFSGLKTAVLYTVKKGDYDKIEMCQEVEQAVIDVLIYKSLKAARDYKIKSIILGGGVAANSQLRKQFKRACSKRNIRYFIPPKNLCTDNGVMIALTAYFHHREREKKIEAKPNLKI